MDFAQSTLILRQTLWLLSPELALLIAGLLIAGLDTFRPAEEEEKNWLPSVSVALVGLACALTATITLWECDMPALSVLSCDPFALTIKTITLVTVAIVVLTSETYVRARVPSHQQSKFYALLLFSTLPMCLLGSTTDLIMIVLAFYFLSVTSYILTGYLRDDRRSVEAAIKYFLYGATLSAVMLYGVSWFYGLTGSTDLTEIATALLESESRLRPVLLPALIFVAAGLAFRIGAVPFHQWAPDAYEGAPTPISAFLSVGPTITGLAIVLRVLLTGLPVELEEVATDWRALLMALSTLTMTVGNLAAIGQDNVKRLLAYSSIAQAGYALIGVVVASLQGVTAVLLYLVAYAAANLGAFTVVIALSCDEIEDYAGLHKRAPGLALVMIVCLLSLAGIPPTAGFVAKLYLFSAALKEGLLWLVALGVINSVVSISYYWKIIHAMYIVPAKTEERLATSPALMAALGVAVVGVFGVGLFANPLLGLLQVAAQTFFGG